MVNGKINKNIFGILDEARKQEGITDRQWAKASGFNAGSRITELRNDYKNRPFSFEKARRLRDGFVSLKGGEVVRKKLIELIKEADTERDKIILLALAIPENHLTTCRMYLEAIVNSEGKRG